MPAVSQKQQRFMALVRSVQTGKAKGRKFSKKVMEAAKNMYPEDVRHFASTKTKDLPEKVASPLDYMFIKGFLSGLSAGS